MSSTDFRAVDARGGMAALAGAALPGTERVLIALVVAMLAAAVALTEMRGQAVAWQAFSGAFAACVGLVALGIYLRLRKDAARLALGVIGFAVFMGFTGAVAIFIFALFPFSAPLIDDALIRADAVFGYDWAGFVTALAAWPVPGTLLGYVYLSSIPQMMGVVALLAFLGRGDAMYRFLFVGIGCMVVTVAIWAAFPSVGPAAHVALPPGAGESIGLVADGTYGAELRRLVAEGLPVITPDRIIGVIAFPSFHMIMACMVVWFTRGTRAFAPAVAVNLLMVPATLAHGGHHLVDLFGAVALFALCAGVAERILPDPRTVRV